MTRKMLLVLILMGLLTSLVAAQSSSGQLCIRAFEDRNGNGEQDANEPPIVRGISASLTDATNVIIDTALIESSSSAASGTLCFQQLAEGQYTIRLASADYTATTPTDYTAQVSDSGIPQVLPYGGQLVPTEAADTSTEPSQEQQIREAGVRAIFAGLGALIIMGAMAVVGTLIYFFVLRNRPQPNTGVYRPVTGAYPAASDTGQYPAVPQRPATDVNPAVEVDDDMPDVRTLETYTMYEDDDTNKPEAPIETDPYGDVSEDDFAFDNDSDTDAPYKPPST